MNRAVPIDWQDVIGLDSTSSPKQRAQNSATSSAKRIPLNDRGRQIDLDLLIRAKNGDEMAFEMLVHRYEWLVRAKARSYFLRGADYEDLIQEGTIGLFKAVRDFHSGSDLLNVILALNSNRASPIFSPVPWLDEDQRRQALKMTRLEVVKDDKTDARSCTDWSVEP